MYLHEGNIDNAIAKLDEIESKHFRTNEWQPKDVYKDLLLILRALKEERKDARDHR